MDTLSTEGLKDYYDKLSHLCDSLDEKDLWNKSDTGIDLSEIFRSDIANYMLFLSASDKFLNPAEEKLFCDVTGYEGNVKELMNVVLEYDLFSPEYAKQLPLILKIVADAEEKTFGSKGIDRPIKLQDTFSTFYKMLGSSVIIADGKITDSEAADLKAIYKTISEFIG